MLQQLISNAIYESILDEETNSVTIRVTHNGGVYHAVAVVDLNDDSSNGKVEGTHDDLREIIAECADIAFEDVDKYLKECGMSASARVKEQAFQDLEVWNLHNDNA